MTVLILASGTCQNLFDCIESARQRSGCDVIVVNSVDNITKNSIHCPFEYIDIPHEILEQGRFSQVRWFMAKWALENCETTPPYYCPDWDDVVLHDVTQHIKALSGNDVLYTQDVGHCSSAAKVFWSKDILSEYVCFVRKICNRLREQWHLSDMNTWYKFIKLHKLKTANLSKDIGFGVFDHNIHTGGDMFELDAAGRKCIEWSDGKPYFVRIEDSKHVPAESIHCWGHSKCLSRTLLEQAGLA